MRISNNLFDTRRSRRGRSPLMLMLGLAVIALVVGAAALWRQQATGLAMRAVAPLMRARQALGAGEAADLRAELATMAARVADRDLLFAENAELKKMLGRGSLGTRIAAGVLMAPPGAPYDTLLIDAGTGNGVAVGDLVSAGGGTVVGSVSEAYEHQARVVLYSAPGSTYQGLLMTAEKSTPLTVNGQGGGSLRAQMPAGTEVVVGDRVVLPGVGGGLSARVSHVERAEGASYVTLYLHLPVNMLEVRLVEVLKP